MIFIIVLNENLNIDDIFGDNASEQLIQNPDQYEETLSVIEVSETQGETEAESFVSEDIADSQFFQSLYSLNIVQNDENCMICLENTNEKLELNCGHFFHFDCLINFRLANHSSCPLCRRYI